MVDRVESALLRDCELVVTPVVERVVTVLAVEPTSAAAVIHEAIHRAGLLGGRLSTRVVEIEATRFALLC